LVKVVIAYMSFKSLLLLTLYNSNEGIIVNSPISKIRRIDSDFISKFHYQDLALP